MSFLEVNDLKIVLKIHFYIEYFTFLMVDTIQSANELLD